MANKEGNNGFWRGIFREGKHVWSTDTGKFLLSAAFISLILLVAIVAIHASSWYEGAIAVVSALFIFFTLSALLETSHFTNVFRNRLKEVVDNVLALNPDYLETMDSETLMDLREAITDRLTKVEDPELRGLMSRISQVESSLLTPYRKNVFIEREYNYTDTYIEIKQLIRYVIVNPLPQSADFHVRQSVEMVPMEQVQNEDLFVLDYCNLDDDTFIDPRELESEYIPKNNRYEFTFSKHLQLEPHCTGKKVEIRSTRYIPFEDRYIYGAVETPINGLTVRFSHPEHITPLLEEFSCQCGSPIEGRVANPETESEWAFDGWFLEGEGVLVVW